jgi:hypothetical protein
MPTRDSSTIFPPYEAFYIDCLLWHTTSAERSITEVGEWLQLVKDDDHRALDLPKPALFERLQNIVHQAAAVSRYFWPSPRKPSPAHTSRGLRLRQGLQVAEGSPLHNRDLRNGLEHFDEKLDQYLSEGRIGHFVPDYVDYVEPTSEVPMHIFKAFYTHSMVFVLLGRRYEMAPLVNEVLRVHSALLQCQANGYRLPYPGDA